MISFTFALIIIIIAVVVISHVADNYGHGSHVRGVSDDRHMSAYLLYGSEE